MHVAFVSLGAFGHVNPTLSVVTELVKRGVRVTYFTTEDFRRIIEPTGAKFVPVPSWMASNAPQNENKGGAEDDGGVAAVVPFLFLNEAGAFLVTKSGDKVAKYFGISKYTLYSYIDANRQEEKKNG